MQDNRYGMYVTLAIDWKNQVVQILGIYPNDMEAVDKISHLKNDNDNYKYFVKTVYNNI